MTETPECDKIAKVQPYSQKIGEFLEWLSGEEIVLAEWIGSDCDECGDERLMNIIMSKEILLAKYFDINLKKAEAERQAILDDIRKQNESED